MTETPGTVIPISLGRLRPSYTRPVGRRGGSRSSARPIRVLVLGLAAAERRRLFRLGRQAAGPESRWIETPDQAAAARMLEWFEFDLVVVDSENAGDSLEWANPSGDRPAPLIALVTGDNEPGRIRRLLDSGAEVLLSPCLPEWMLRDELYALTALSSKRLRGSGARPIAFPKGNC